MSETVKFFQMSNAQGLALPAYATAGAAGFDLTAAIDAPITLLPGSIVLIKTGLKAAVPVGFELQVRPRSGLALKHGITVLNSPGTVDSDYRGEIGVILHNAGHMPFTVQRGDRIAQAIIARYEQAIIIGVENEDELGTTERGEGGFGSTGRN